VEIWSHGRKVGSRQGDCDYRKPIRDIHLDTWTQENEYAMYYLRAKWRSQKFAHSSRRVTQEPSERTAEYVTRRLEAHGSKAVRVHMPQEVPHEASP